MERASAGTIVERQQLEVLSVAEGFFQSSVLFALLKLGVFERVEEGRKTGGELAGELGADPAFLTRLLDAGLVLNLLEWGQGGYGVATACRSVLLPSAGANYLGNWIRNLDYFREALAGLDEAVLRAGPTVDPAGHLGDDPAHTREFTLAMHNYASLRGQELGHYLDTHGCKSLLDLGCGPGTYAFCLGLRNPELELHLLDLPGVLEVAREVQAQYPLQNIIHYLPRDILSDEIPGSYDLVLVSNTLHMLGEEASRRLIKRLHGSVKPGGSLVIQAQYLQDDRRGGRWPVFLDLIQLCITRHGRNHSVAETRGWLEEAGFTQVEHRSMSVYNTNSFLRGYRR
jgi:SAM-dependent methyltransferase